MKAAVVVDRHTEVKSSLMARMPFLLACTPFIELLPPLATSPSSQSRDERECTGDSCRGNGVWGGEGVVRGGEKDSTHYNSNTNLY